jgi:hypothetical protein
MPAVANNFRNNLRALVSTEYGHGQKLKVALRLHQPPPAPLTPIQWTRSSLSCLVRTRKLQA